MKAFDGTAKLVRRRCPFNLTGDIQDLSCFRAGADRPLRHAHGRQARCFARA